MADKKEIRVDLSTSETCFMLLMPLSQMWAWTTLFRRAYNHTLALTLQEMLPPLCIFHVLWALKNRYSGNKHERGHLTMGTVAAGSLMGLDGAGFYVALAGAAMVWGSFAMVASRVVPWPDSKLAYLMKKTEVWAMVFKAYMSTNTMLWLLLIVALVRTRYA